MWSDEGERLVLGLDEGAKGGWDGAGRREG